MASGSGERPRPVLVNRSPYGPSGYRPAIRLGPTTANSTGNIAAPQAQVTVGPARWTRVATGPATARPPAPVTAPTAPTAPAAPPAPVATAPAASSASYATVCPQGVTVSAAGPSRWPGFRALHLAQAPHNTRWVYRFQAPPRITTPAPQPRRSRTSAAYPLSSQSSTGPRQSPELMDPSEGWQSLLQAARERSAQRADLQGRHFERHASTLMSVTAMRALEEMVQAVDDFGSEDGSCSICLGTDCDPSEASTQVVELRCGNRHRFHKQCINTWMVASIAVRDGMPRCPLCRKGLNMGQGSRRNVLDLSLQELVAVERLLEDVRLAVLEQRTMMENREDLLEDRDAMEGNAIGPGGRLIPHPLRAAQERAIMLEDRVTELRSAVYDLQSRLSLL